MESHKHKPLTLRYPKAHPPSLLKRLILPRCWKLPKQPCGLTLPTDPSKLIDEFNRARTDVTEPQVAIRDTRAAQEIRQSDLIEFAIQTWRLEKRADSLDPKQFKREHRQFADSVRRFRKFLSRFEVDFRDPVKAAEAAGNPELLRFDTGMKDIEVVSWDDPEEESPPEGVSGAWIKQTISPVIYKGSQIIKRGEVVCVDPT